MTKKRLDQPLVVAGLVGAMGVQVAVCILIGYWVGAYVSDWTGSKGWLVGGVLTGLACGIGSSILVVLKVLEGSDE
jgi:ATP synthase protein I